VTATEVSDEDVAALNQMRATLRLPALIVTADGPRNGKDSSSRIRNPIGERRLLSNPVPRVCVGYEGPCIAPRKRQLLHEHHRTRFTNAPPTGNDGPPYWQTAEPRNPLQTSRLPTKLLGCHAPIPQAINAVAGDTVRILPQLLAAPTSCPARTRCRNGKFPERQRRRPGTPMPRRHPIVLVEGDDLVARKTTSSSVA
jgi:hypothetical protein